MDLSLYRSFYLEPVYRLVPVFNPFLMASLLVFKIIAPYVLLSAAFATLNRRVELQPYSLFLVALSLTDGAYILPYSVWSLMHSIVLLTIWFLFRNDIVVLLQCDWHWVMARNWADNFVLCHHVYVACLECGYLCCWRVVDLWCHGWYNVFFSLEEKVIQWLMAPWDTMCPQ